MLIVILFKVIAPELFSQVAHIDVVSLFHVYFYFFTLKLCIPSRQERTVYFICSSGINNSTLSGDLFPRSIMLKHIA